MTTSEIYHNTVKPLPPTERLRLAVMILNEIVPPSDAAVDVDESWSPTDLDEFTAASWASWNRSALVSP